jgi:major membrane immunogen (membrane-anchored lipoprotein)
MYKMITAIAISSLLMLTACGKPAESDQQSATGSGDAQQSATSDMGTEPAGTESVTGSDSTGTQ